jgi:predicted secreted protein
MASPSVRAAALHGVALGLLVAAWTLVMGVTGWYRDPALQAAFFVVIPIQIGLVVALLRRTSNEHGYRGQVALGTLASAIAAPIVLVQSLVFTTLLFPSYFDDLRAAHAALLRADGVPEAEIAVRATAAAEANGDSLSNAVTGAIATIVTGLVVSAVTAAFARKR